MSEKPDEIRGKLSEFHKQEWIKQMVVNVSKNLEDGVDHLTVIWNKNEKLYWESSKTIEGLMCDFEQIKYWLLRELEDQEVGGRYKHEASN